MNYVTGKIIKELREEKKLTQKQLADMLNVSDKTISKWETSKGLPDISLIEPLSKSLNVSIIELMSGSYINNDNRSSDILKTKIYVCPVCGNVINSIGDVVVSCCGITLPLLEAEEDDSIEVEIDGDEYYIKINHEMTKNHYISFIAYVTKDKFNMIKFYPESNSEGRFIRQGHGIIYAYCNKHGLMKKIV